MSDFSKSILIVDDNEFVLELLGNTLTEGGYKVLKANNGQEALSKCQKFDFDLIITDIIMPEKDGIQFINELREVDKNIPIIAISGGDEKGNTENFINFANYFANETLTKPFAKDDLIKTVHSLINDLSPDEALQYL